MFRRIALIAVLIAGCRRGGTPPAAPGDAIVPVGAAAPAQFADLPPGDTAAVVAMMRQTMQRIDASLPVLVRRDTVLAAVADSTPRHLSIWLQDGTVRKLVSLPDSGTNGANDGETDIWFVGGDVAVVQRVADAYAIDAGRIVLWTDETLQPRSDVMPAQVMAREGELMTLARQWLMPFRISLP